MRQFPKATHKIVVSPSNHHHCKQRKRMRRRQIGQDGLDNSASDRLDNSSSAIESQIPKHRSASKATVVKGHPQLSSLRFFALFLSAFGIIGGLYYYIDSSTGTGKFHSEESAESGDLGRCSCRLSSYSCARLVGFWPSDCLQFFTRARSATNSNRFSAPLPLFHFAQPYLESLRRPVLSSCFAS
jgi:hypothetical protein